MAGAIQEIRFALRTLAGRPALTSLIITTLALGIGATTTVFSVVDQTLLRRAPFVHADRLVDVLDVRRGGGGGNSLSPAKILGWQAQSLAFERIAVGATPADIVGLILARGAVLTAAGLVLGAMGAAALARLLETLLYGIGARDPVSFIAVAGVLAVVALLACWIPTRRALRVQPATALRTG